MTKRDTSGHRMPAWPAAMDGLLAETLGARGAAAWRTVLAYSGGAAICSVVCPAAMAAVVVDKVLGRSPEHGNSMLDTVRRQVWARSLVSWCGVSLTASGTEHIADTRPRVYVANHQSYLDIPAAHIILPPDVRMVSKSAIKWVPFLGQSMLMAGYPFVDRRNPEAAHSSLDQLAAQIRDGISVLVFAEGTRTRDGAVGPFKKGAFVMALKAGVPIVPVGIAGSFEALGRHTGTLTPGHVHLHLLPEIATTGMALDDRHLLRDRVREAVIAAKDIAQQERDQHTTQAHG